MSRTVRGAPVTFIVREHLFWHEAPCLLSLPTGRYIAVPTLPRSGADIIDEPVAWEIRKDAGLLTMSATQARLFQRSGRLEIKQTVS